MGKQYQLSTPLLKIDYRDAASLLRDYAKTIKQQTVLLAKILGDSESTKYANPREINIKVARQLAKRFADRARRM